MPDKSTQAKFILISLCIGAVVVSIPVDKIDNDIRNPRTGANRLG